MAFFRYDATDPSGKVIQGTLQAVTPEEARKTLAANGLQVRMLRHGEAPVTVAPVRVQPAPIVKTEQPRQISVATLPKQDLGVVRTRPGNDKANFLIFSQLATYLKSGVNAQLAMREIAAKQSRADYREALSDVANRSMEGGAMSTALARYPDLFPADIVGTLRAGEASGYVPDALTLIGNTAEAGWRLRKQLAWGKWMALGLLAAFPVSMALVNGGLGAIAAQDAAGGELDRGQIILSEVMKAFRTWLPVLLGGVAILALIGWGWAQARFLDLRHKLLLWVPLLGKRAKAESMARFAWAMAMGSRAGLAPRDSYELGARSMPNRHLAAQMLVPLTGATEATKASAMLRESGVVQREYQDVLETGEMVGDVPGAMMRMAQAQAVEFEGEDAAVGKKVIYIFFPLLGILTLALAAMLYSRWYGGLIQVLTKD